jgi:hypothetical protein
MQEERGKDEASLKLASQIFEEGRKKHEIFVREQVGFIEKLRKEEARQYDHWEKQIQERKQAFEAPVRNQDEVFEEQMSMIKSLANGGGVLCDILSELKDMKGKDKAREQKMLEEIGGMKDEIKQDLVQGLSRVMEHVSGELKQTVAELKSQSQEVLESHEETRMQLLDDRKRFLSEFESLHQNMKDMGLEQAANSMRVENQVSVGLREMKEAHEELGQAIKNSKEEVKDELKYAYDRLETQIAQEAEATAKSVKETVEKLQKTLEEKQGEAKKRLMAALANEASVKDLADGSLSMEELIVQLGQRKHAAAGDSAGGSEIMAELKAMREQIVDGQQAQFRLQTELDQNRVPNLFFIFPQVGLPDFITLDHVYALSHPRFHLSRRNKATWKKSWVRRRALGAWIWAKCFNETLEHCTCFAAARITTRHTGTSCPESRVTRLPNCDSGLRMSHHRRLRCLGL